MHSFLPLFTTNIAAYIDPNSGGLFAQLLVVGFVCLSSVLCIVVGLVTGIFAFLGKVLFGRKS